MQDARHLEKYLKLQLDINVTVDPKTATHTIEGVTFSVRRPSIGAHAVDIYAQYNGGREAHVYKTWMLDSGQMHSEVPLGQSLQSILANLGYKAS